MNILFICKKRYSYGINNDVNSFGLINSAKLVCNYLSDFGIRCKAIIVNDANDIDREVSNYNPSHVILEALWVTPDKMREIVKLHQNRKWIIRLHSRIPFLSYEGIAIEWIHEFINHKFLKRHIKIASNSYSTVRELSHLLKTNLIYLPNLYPISWKNKVFKENGDIINIGSFGSIRPLKNTLIQAIAAIKFADKIGKKLYFHINEKTEQHADGVLKNLRNLFKYQSNHTLVEHEWYEYDKFIDVLNNMDLGMQVSYSETFNIVIADFVNNNIPVVVSHEIYWLPEYAKTNTNSVNDIYRTLRSVWRFRFLGETFINKLYLRFYNKSSEKKWLKFLDI